MEREEIEKKVNEAVIDVLDCESTEIMDSASLENDLCVDSLDAVEIEMKLEDSFGITLENARNCTTVKDLYDFVEKEISK